MLVFESGSLANFTAKRTAILGIVVTACCVESRSIVVLSWAQLLHRIAHTFLCLSRGSSYFDLIEYDK
jgi:hypothetical protein